MPSGQLDSQIAAAVGDPSTCVLVADAASGKELYRYGEHFNCDRELPACDAVTPMNAHAALKLGRDPGRPDGQLQHPARSGSPHGRLGPRVEVQKRLSQPDLLGGDGKAKRALPGHEINARLYDAFQKAGL